MDLRQLTIMGLAFLKLPHRQVHLGLQVFLFVWGGDRVFEALFKYENTHHK